MGDSRRSESAPQGFGTFGGVFAPCTLTILGVIMFLRFGHVVAQGGLWHALAIVLCAKIITTLTTLSLSAIATNTRVKGGGAYFLISRSLGVEAGGAIGVVFYLAQAISVAMYVIGFVEALLVTFPEIGLDARVLGTVVNVVVATCVLIGASWTIKVQYGILAILAASLVSFFTGAIGKASLANLQANLAPGYLSGHGFFTMFALFFPAATGIMAGANMSGDLRDPQRAIPRGTLASVAVTGAIYALIAVALAASGDRDALMVVDQPVMPKLSAWPVLITAGVFCATISSALGSMMGAPRILQALGKDQVFDTLRPFAAGSGPLNEPRRAVLVTFVIAQGAILLGDLDLIAPIITMFFMMTYGYLNLATFRESITANPSYRPSFRLSHWSTALAGAVGCGAVMLLISWPAAIASGAVILMLQWVIAKREVSALWGEDLQHGAAYRKARHFLLSMEDERYHPKNWRPSILVLGGGAWSREHLSVWGHWLSGSRGMLTLGQVIVGDVEEKVIERRAAEVALRKYIRENHLPAFAAALVSPKLQDGVAAMVQAAGIGSLRPNLIMLGWSRDPERRAAFGSTLRTVSGLDRSLAVIRGGARREDPWKPPDGPIDVWWRGHYNGALMLLLAHLLRLDSAWQDRPIRVLRMIRNAEEVEQSTEELTKLCRGARIDAQPLVLVGDDFPACLQKASADSAVTFIGFLLPDADESDGALEALDRMFEGLGTVILVASAHDMTLEA